MADHSGGRCPAGGRGAEWDRRAARSRCARLWRRRRPRARRCDAPAKRCTSACGRRASRSCRYRSENTGSDEPHSRRTGTSPSSSRPVPLRSGFVAGMDRSSGISRTNSPMRRGRRVRYGARIGLAHRRRTVAAATVASAPRMNVAVFTVSRRGHRGAGRRGSVAARPRGRLVHGRVHQHDAGELVAVASAQPNEIGPPQSWATVTTGPRARARR